MGTGPRLGVGRIHLLQAPSSCEERRLNEERWDVPTMLLLALGFGEGTVASQVGYIVASTLLGVPNTYDSTLGCFYIQYNVLGEGRPPHSTLQMMQLNSEEVICFPWAAADVSTQLA